MSLVGYKVKNHPQQVGKRGARPEIDDRAITTEDFAPLHKRFNFTIDAAASDENARLPWYWTRENSALDRPWSHKRVWCNPPHSDLETWVNKAWSEWVGEAEPPQLIVMLVPANRTEQGWWQREVEPHRDGHGFSPEFRVEFLAGRMRFLAPGATDIKPNERPPYGCCLLIWGDA